VLDVYFAQVRLYDAGNKRFAQADPVGGSVANPLSLNAYLYCRDDPVDNIDPTGMVMPGDEKRSEVDQAAIAAATDAYYAAANQAERDAAHAAAEYVRNHPSDSSTSTISGKTGYGSGSIYPSFPTPFIVLSNAIAQTQHTLPLEDVFKTSAQWLNNINLMANDDRSWLKPNGGLSLEAQAYLKYYNSQRDANSTNQRIIESTVRLAYDIGVKDQNHSIKGSVYDVPIFKQQGDLCWAYSQVMVEAYNNNETITKAEADKRAEALAKEYHGTEIKEDQIILVGPYEVELKGWNHGGWPPNEKILNANNLTDKRLLEAVDDGPLYAYYGSPNEKRHHLIVITGAVSAEGHISLVTTNNPWGDQNIQTFDEFIAGIPGDNQPIANKMKLIDIRMPG
jgi:RHS repeat-associated protein